MDYMGVRKKIQIIPFSKATHAIYRRLDMLKEAHIITDGTHMEIFINSNENKNSNELDSLLYYLFYMLCSLKL